MKGYRAALVGGVCLGLLANTASAGDSTTSQSSVPAWAAEAKANPDYDGTVPSTGEGEYGGTVAGDLGAGLERNDPGQAEKGVSGVTSFYGDTAPASPPAWAAEAAMNPDYNASAASAEPAAAPEASSAVVANDPGEAPKGVPGVTSYYGDTAPASPPAFAAEAAMNPGYTADAPAAEAPAATSPPVVANDPGEAPHGVSGVTSYYGDTAPASPPAWAAEATMNAASAAAASPATQEAVEACRDSLNGEAKTGIQFASNKWDVLPASYKTLDRIAKIAKDCNANFVIEIGGHTDSVGTPVANQQISELRAKSVVSYLSGKGVPAAKLKAVGYGQSKPVADNATAEGRAKNRRIEFLVTAN